jgi:integrase
VLIPGERPLLPEGLKQHSLRHTTASLRLAIGHDLATVSVELGHADVSVTARIYPHTMKLDGDEKARLKALWEGTELAPAGTRSDSEEEPDASHVADLAL